MRRRRIAVLFALVTLGSFVSLSLTACGGDSSGSTTPAPTDMTRTTCRPPQNAVPGTAIDVPQGLAEYRSPERGYRVAYPADWLVRPNIVGVSNIAGDAFFSNDSTGKVTPNIAVTCETVPIGTTSGDFVDAKRTVVQQTRGKLPEIEKLLTVNGSEAASIAYSTEAVQESVTITADKVEVYFADEMGGWTISLTVPTGGVAAYRPAFDSLVQSYSRP